MFLEDGQKYLPLLSGGNIHQPNDAWMFAPQDEDKLPEVLVQCHENAAVDCGSGQDGVVPRVSIPVAGVVHVMAGCPKFVGHWGPDSGVEQEANQSLPAMTGSMRSLAAARLA